MKTREEVEKTVRDILVSDFEIDGEKLVPEANLFEELDLDSIDAIDLVVRLQQTTGKKLDPVAFRQIRTYGDVVDAAVKVVNEG